MAFLNNYWVSVFKQSSTCIKYLRIVNQRIYHTIPFLEFYHQTTGDILSDDQFTILKKRHRGIEKLNQDQLACAVQTLGKFNISAEDACCDVHVLCMNPISVDNYGEILKECGFVNILPKHIIHYHTIVRSRSIAQLKKEGLMRTDVKLEERLFKQLLDLPEAHKLTKDFQESITTILTVRKSVLQKYLTWKLSISDEEFEKYIRNYRPLKHKPMSDIQETFNLAQNTIGLDLQIVRRNGFLISSDPINTKLILENVKELSGLDIKEAVRVEPAILKNNYRALLEIRSLLEEYRIPLETQQRCLKIYCMKPSTVRERLEGLKNTNEYKILSTNPRLLSLVIHKKKMQQRLQKIENVKKQCYSLNRLVSSSNVFNNYISNFGDKVCGRDIAILICSSLTANETTEKGVTISQSEMTKDVLKKMKRHKFWLHSALHVIAENIKNLKQKFNDEVILDNCQILLYPVNEIQQHLNFFLNKRNGFSEPNVSFPKNIDRSMRCSELTDSQILSLVLYEMEKNFHFSGDGIWPKQI